MVFVYNIPRALLLDGLTLEVARSGTAVAGYCCWPKLPSRPLPLLPSDDVDAAKSVAISFDGAAIMNKRDARERKQKEKGKNSACKKRPLQRVQADKQVEGEKKVRESEMRTGG